VSVQCNYCLVYEMVQYDIDVGGMPRVGLGAVSKWVSTVYVSK